MKSIAFYIGAFLAASTLFSACDIVDNPMPAPAAPYNKRALDSLETKHGFATPVQKVLLEDYTGHQCGNCPGAAAMAKTQKAKYGDRLVVMAVHAGYFAKVLRNDSTNLAKKFIYNFSTPAGEEWLKEFGIQSNPNGMVNRKPAGSSTSFYQGVSSWSGSIATEMTKTPQIGMTLTSFYEETDRKVHIKVRSEYLENLTGKYNLAVFITEDSIVNWQKNYAAGSGGDPAYPVGDIEKFTHSHALRAAVDGTWGRINKENPVKNQVANAYFAFNLEPGWNAKKCSVVAFIYNEETKQVLQVEEKHIH